MKLLLYTFRLGLIIFRFFFTYTSVHDIENEMTIIIIYKKPSVGYKWKKLKLESQRATKMLDCLKDFRSIRLEEDEISFFFLISARLRKANSFSLSLAFSENII